MKIKQDVRSVYVILNEDTGKVKLGYSDNPEKRMQTLIQSAGCRMKLIYKTKPIYNYGEVEKDIHALFNEKRYMYEWFSIPPDFAAKRLKSLVVNAKSCIIVAHFENGKNPTKIAAIMNVSRSGIVKYLKGKGITIREKTNPTPIKQETNNNTFVSVKNIPPDPILDLDSFVSVKKRPVNIKLKKNDTPNSVKKEPITKEALEEMVAKSKEKTSQNKAGQRVSH